MHREIPGWRKMVFCLVSESLRWYFSFPLFPVSRAARIPKWWISERAVRKCRMNRRRKRPLRRLPDWKKRRKSCRRLWISLKIRDAIPNWAPVYRRAWFWWDRREPVKPFWQKRLQAKPAFRFSAFPVRILSRCLSVSALPVSGIYSKKRRSMRRVSYLLMRLMRLPAGEVPVWAAAMTKESRHWTSFWLRWMVSVWIRESLLWQRQTV